MVVWSNCDTTEKIQSEELTKKNRSEKAERRREEKRTLLGARRRRRGFEENLCERLIADVEASYNKWRHPDPYIVNNVVCHFSPLASDEAVLEEGDILEIDMACHIDGFIAAVAHTHVLQDGPVSGRAANVIAAANTAAEVALRLVRPGKKYQTLFTWDAPEELKGVISKKDHELVYLYNSNLVDEIWKESRPKPPNNPVRVHDLKYAGLVASKLSILRSELVNAGSSAIVISMLDEIAWLLNLVEPQKFSAYREVAVNAIAEALDSSLNDEKAREKCCRALLILCGHFSSTGKIPTKTSTLKQAGYNHDGRKLKLTKMEEMEDGRRPNDEDGLFPQLQACLQELQKRENASGSQRYKSLRVLGLKRPNFSTSALPPLNCTPAVPQLQTSKELDAQLYPSCTQAADLQRAGRSAVSQLRPSYRLPEKNVAQLYLSFSKFSLLHSSKLCDSSIPWFGQQASCT
ncbi:hypothetical protein V8G54_033072 [Vigna mungo]|uniref:Peptidase M24 domain-containing protein n=1 Tax=Vigna mungo TaxID=3915 RepID=A0AAQ3MMA0_VIGMU